MTSPKHALLEVDSFRYFFLIIGKLVNILPRNECVCGAIGTKKKMLMVVLSNNMPEYFKLCLL